MQCIDRNGEPRTSVCPGRRIILRYCQRLGIPIRKGSSRIHENPHLILFLNCDRKALSCGSPVQIHVHYDGSDS